MTFKRRFTRFVAALTTISLLLPTAVFALTATVQATASDQTSRTPTLPAVITLQAHDLFGLLNGELGGIPQFGLTADMGMKGVGESRTLASRVGAVLEARADDQYAAVPLSSETSIGLPDVALVGNADTDVLLKANGQASEAFKLTSLASMPRLIETPMQALTSRAATQALTIKSLLDRTLAAAPAAYVAAKAVGSNGAHTFGSVLTGLKPTVDAAPFGREWATVIFGSFTAELVLRLGAAPEGAFTSTTPSWVAIWLELLFGLAGLAALSRAQSGRSARHALLVILNREQRE